MNKDKRQSILTEIIRTKRIASQAQLHQELMDHGIEAVQSSISRDFAELGIVKSKGTYRLPEVSSGKMSMGTILEIDTAGDNLIVIKTPPGQSSMTALTIDKIKIPGVVGTIAGDDTLFVATKTQTEQKRVMKQIMKIIR